MFSKTFSVAALLLCLSLTPATAAEEVILDTSQDVASAEVTEAVVVSESVTVSQDASADVVETTAAPETVSPDETQQVVASPDAVSADAASTDVETAEVEPEHLLSAEYEFAIANVQQGRDKLTEDVTALLAQGKEKNAVRAIGAAVGRERKGSTAYLGRFCVGLLDSGTDRAAQIKFLAQFVRGYGRSGALLLFTDGVENVKAYGKRFGTPWKVVSDGVATNPKTDRIYRGQDVLVIPFAAGEVFKLDVFGKDGGTVRICKIMQGGVNEKSWPGGKWQREVTVRGDKLF